MSRGRRDDEHGHDTLYEWLLAHSGVSGNDRTDESPHCAHASSRISSANSHLASLAPDSICLPAGLPKCAETLLNQQRFGGAFTISYSFISGWADSPTFDGRGCEETIAHILRTCLRYCTEMKVLPTVLGIVDSLPLSD